MSTKPEVFKETDEKSILIKLRRFADRYPSFDTFLKDLI